MCVLAAVSAVSIRLVEADLKEVIGTQQLTLASQEADDIDEKFALRMRALQAAAREMTRQAGAQERIDGMQIETFPALHELFDDVFVFSPAGQVIARSPPVQTQSLSADDRAYFQQTLEKKLGVISEPYLAKASKQPSIMLTAPILGAAGTVLGVIGGQLALLKPNFLGQLSRDRVGKTGAYALIGKDRTIVVSRDLDRILTKGPQAGITHYFDRVVRGEDGWEQDVNSRGLHAVFGFKQMTAVPWAVVTALPVEEAFAPIAEAQKRIAIGALLIGLLFAPFVWFGTGRLLRPLTDLQSATHEIQADGGQGLLLPDERRDEIGDLARAFNALLTDKRETQARLLDVTDNMDALIGYIDGLEIYRFTNRAYEDWMGSADKRVTGRTVRDVLGETEYAKFQPWIGRAMNGERVEFQAELEMKGKVRAVQVIYVPNVTSVGRVEGFYSLVSDVSRLKAAERKLVEAVNTDALTGVASRSLFLDRLEQALLRSRRSGSHLAILYIDVDNFKSINDSLGHAAGDALLREFASRLLSNVRETDTVARMGGDEFIVLLEALTDPADATRIAQKIVDSERVAIPFKGNELRITASIGVAYTSESDADADALLLRADGALYEAKAEGRDRYKVSA